MNKSESFGRCTICGLTTKLSYKSKGYNLCEDCENRLNESELAGE